MKKLILLILASTLLCSAARAETLVVWFSCTGNTEAAFRRAACICRGKRRKHSGLAQSGSLRIPHPQS